MPSRLLRVLSRTMRSFASERKGQVAITFALAFIPALTMAGAAIDYSRAVAQRSNLQQAADATVLAIAHTYLTPQVTGATLTAPTQTYLTGVMGSIAPNPSNTKTVNGVTATPNAATLDGAPILSQSNTSMCINTMMIVPTQVMTIVQIPYVAVRAQACSQVGGTYEIAMVLDNSYSMSESLGSGTKMDALHTAATNLVNIMIPSGVKVPTAAISLVPFNALVNVGTSRTASFLDVNGQSSLNWKEVSKPSWTSQPSRLSLFDTVGVAWGGCVEDRPNNLNSSTAPDHVNYMTTDVAASSSVADSLFVPYFAPDDPGGISSNSGSTYGIGYLYNSFSDCNSYSGNGGNGNCSSNKTSYSFQNSYLTDLGQKSTNLSNCTTANFTADNAAANTYPGSGMTLACKYYKNVVASSTNNLNQWFGLGVGPNADCTTPAITPLTTNSTTLTSAINAMQPTGLTNLGTGFMWGWRTISPTVNPFPISSPAAIGQQNPKTYVYGPPSNTKVIILMTDGYNTWSPIITTASQQYINPATQTGYTFGISNPYKSAYEAFGFMSENRLANYNAATNSDGTCPTPITDLTNITNYTGFRCQMDNMLLESCNNAKAKGIYIYTVGFSIANDAIDQEGINALTACATSPSFYYQASDATSITLAFQKIAASITNLRISQ